MINLAEKVKTTPYEKFNINKVMANVPLTVPSDNVNVSYDENDYVDFISDERFSTLHDNIVKINGDFQELLDNNLIPSDNTDFESDNNSEVSDDISFDKKDDLNLKNLDGTIWDDDKMAVIFDSATMGAIKRNNNLFFWEIDGLLKDNGKQHSWMTLNNNPPKLIFKRPNDKPFVVFLGKEEVSQLLGALERVRKAYNAMPIEDEKKERINKHNWKRIIREHFEDNPLGFIGKIAGVIAVIIVIILALTL